MSRIYMIAAVSKGGVRRFLTQAGTLATHPYGGFMPADQGMEGARIFRSLDEVEQVCSFIRTRWPKWARRAIAADDFEIVSEPGVES